MTTPAAGMTRAELDDWARRALAEHGQPPEHLKSLIRAAFARTGAKRPA